MLKIPTELEMKRSNMMKMKRVSQSDCNISQCNITATFQQTAGCLQIFREYYVITVLVKFRSYIYIVQNMSRICLVIDGLNVILVMVPLYM